MIHEALLPAVAVATEEVKGPPLVNQGGEVVAPPTTGQLLTQFQTYQQQTDAIIATLRGTIGQLTDLLNGKASADSLATLRQRVTTAEATLATTATTAYVSQQVQAIADVDSGQASAIAGLTSLLATDGGILQNLLGKTATYDLLLPALRTDVDAKATAATVSALTGQVTTVRNLVTDSATGLATRASAADLTTQKGRIDGLLTTTVPALQADTALRLLRSGDVATGSIMVPQATTGPAAPRFDQTFGGLNAPIRYATAVGATSVALLPGPLTDPTPQGRQAKPYQVLLTMRTAPTVGLNVTISIGTTAGGSQVFTKTYLLTALPGLTALLAPMQPVYIILPPGTTLYAQATGGTWDVEVLSYYKA